jgi:hypothetical protein
MSRVTTGKIANRDDRRRRTMQSDDATRYNVENKRKDKGRARKGKAKGNQNATM